MEKLSGLVLDHYDDREGDVLRSIFPTEESIDPSIKTAHRLTPEEHAALPADVFALELVDGDIALKKYACTDAGNTALSVEYFFKTGHKLPEDAQKVAAANLVTACGWYGLEPREELQKIALGVGTLMSLSMAPSIAKGTKQQINQNLAVAKASGGAVNPGTTAAGRRAGYGR